MESVLFSGLFDLSWRGLVAVVLALTHITIASVTIFLRRLSPQEASGIGPLVEFSQRLRSYA